MADIRWLNWSKDVFERSKHEQKPVLLFISAHWCEQCHAMRRSTFGDESIAQKITAGFIAVTVDADERPDLCHRFSVAPALGGVPSTVFLNSAGKVLARGTFIPAPKMSEILDEVSENYPENPGAAESGDLSGVNESTSELSHGQVEASWILVENVLDSLQDEYDPKYGGFHRAPKWVWPEAILLSAASGLWGFDAPTIRGAHTLKAIYQSALRDRIDEGFFRYGSRRDWSEPYYEKLLDLNAWLMECYLTGYGLFGTHESLTAAREIADYLDTVLWQEEPGLYASSQQADREYFSLDAAGRRKRTPPSVDASLYTQPNATAAMSLFHFWWISRNTHYLDRASRIADEISARGMASSGACAHELTRGEASELEGYIADQAMVALMMCEAYQATAETQYLDKARAALGYCEQKLVAPGGAFYDLSGDYALSQFLKPLVPVDENALLARAYVSYWGSSGDDSFAERARHIVDAIMPVGESSYRDVPRALAAAIALRPVSVIAGSSHSPLAFAAKQRMVPALGLRYDKSLENTVMVSTPGEKGQRLASLPDLSRALEAALNPRGSVTRGRFEALPSYQRLYVH